MKIDKLVRSDNASKKYDIYLFDEAGKQHKITFGARGYNDYTIYSKRSKVLADLHKEAYLKRHKPTEDWTRSGLLTAGFWSRWLLWNLPTVSASLQDVKKRFGM